MNKELMQQFIDANPNLVQMRESIRYPGLFVVKYKKPVFYDNLWNDVLEECRGLVVDENFNIVSRPFTKIYNYGVEKRAPKFKLRDQVNAFRKINGFMAALTWYNNDILVSTTGSLDSKFVDYVYEMIGDNLDSYKRVLSTNSNYTFMFECVHPEDPHIIPETEGMYVLGYRAKTWNSSIQTYFNSSLCRQFTNSILVEAYYDVPLSVVLDMSRECQHEGFVLYHRDGRAAKIKSPYYLINKFVARNPRTDKLMRPDIKSSIDEEYYPLIDAIQSNIKSYTAMTEQERLVWVREFFNA